MATTNQNVPAAQADAAKSSAPDAKVVAQQPVASNPTSSQSGSNGQAATPAAAAGSQQASNAQVPVDGAKRSGTAASDAVMKSTPDQSPEDKMKSIEQGRDEEQKVGDQLDAANANSDYFQQVANDDAVYNDPTRQEHRAMRAREAEEKKGDVTRDPVAKQEKMDMNTPQPGAAEEAEEINQGDDANKRSK